MNRNGSHGGKEENSVWKMSWLPENVVLTS